MTISFNEPAPSFEDVWRLFQETDRKFQETDRKFQETDRKFQETDRKLQETDRLLKESIAESKQRSKELDKKMGRLSNRIGDFVEEILRPGIAKLFQQRGIPIYEVHGDVSKNDITLNMGMQIDLFIVNTDSCALIEVKSKLSHDDVTDHVDRMNKFKTLFPKYSDMKVYGAVAAMVVPDEVARHAYRKGFFVIAQSGENVIFLNDNDFKPKAW
jgi:hypothetical protein